MSATTNGKWTCLNAAILVDPRRGPGTTTRVSQAILAAKACTSILTATRMKLVKGMYGSDVFVCTNWLVGDTQDMPKLVKVSISGRGRMS